MEQTQTFTHLLGDENTAVHNYGAGGTGLDFAVKTLSEVYIPESRRQIFIITMPHYFRRTWFDDDGVVLRAWQVKELVNINEYNNYYHFLHQYNILNSFVGKNKRGAEALIAMSNELAYYKSIGNVTAEIAFFADLGIFWTRDLSRSAGLYDEQNYADAGVGFRFNTNIFEKDLYFRLDHPYLTYDDRLGFEINFNNLIFSLQRSL
mgnify:CR=1 FL=1